MFNVLESDIEQISQLMQFAESLLDYHRQCSQILQGLSETLYTKTQAASSRQRREFVPKTLEVEMYSRVFQIVIFLWYVYKKNASLLNTGCFISSDMVSNLYKIIIFWSFQAEILDLETSDLYIFENIFRNKNFWQKKGMKNDS